MRRSIQRKPPSAPNVSSVVIAAGRKKPMPTRMPNPAVIQIDAAVVLVWLALAYWAWTVVRERW